MNLFDPRPKSRSVLACTRPVESLLDHFAATGSEQRARLSRLRQSILKWAFEGKVVDQHLNDKPAAVPLERIRAERATRAENNGKRAGVARSL